MSANPDRRWDEALRPQPPDADAVLLAKAAAEDDGRPDFRKAYRAFGHPRRQLRSLFIYFNAAERRRYGKKKIQVQYEHLDSDDPAGEGFAEDGQSFSFVVTNSRRALRITVRGCQLEEGYDFISFHRMPWIRSADRDFGQADGPVITSIEIEAVEEPSIDRIEVGECVGNEAVTEWLTKQAPAFVPK